MHEPPTNSMISRVCASLQIQGVRNMINTAEEFVNLRQSQGSREQEQASLDFADINVWLSVIEKYPDFKIWVVHNKTIQIEILEILASDNDPKIRSEVARKRKINDIIYERLSIDLDEEVRYALMYNTKLTKLQIERIKVEDSQWLKEKLVERLEILKMK